MTDRDRLIEVMAMAFHPGIWDQPDNPALSLLRNIARSRAIDCIAAAERAGFEFRMKEEKR